MYHTEIKQRERIEELINEGNSFDDAYNQLELEVDEVLVDYDALYSTYEEGMDLDDMYGGEDDWEDSYIDDFND